MTISAPARAMSLALSESYAASSDFLQKQDIFQIDNNMAGMKMPNMNMADDCHKFMNNKQKHNNKNCCDDKCSCPLSHCAGIVDLYNHQYFSYKIIFDNVKYLHQDDILSSNDLDKLRRPPRA